MRKFGIIDKVTQKKPSLANAGSGFEDQKFEDIIYWGIIIASIVGIIVIIAFIVLNQQTASEANAFTAVYFGDYNKDVSSGTANFGFAIENHEGKTTNYIVDINFDSTTIKTIEITLEKDQNFDTNVSLPFSLSQRIVHKISVSLRNRTESIHYWTRVKKDYLATFGENIAFISYQIDQNNTNTSNVKVGQDFNISYTWKCLKPTDINYTIFVHFVGSAGKVIFQGDHSPQITDENGLQKAYPTSQCEIGKTFTETYKLKASVQGNYPIRIGLYTKENGRMETDNDEPSKFVVIGSLNSE